MLLCIPDLPKILLLNMDCLFFPVLFSNSMPKILYPKPTTNLSRFTNVDGGWFGFKTAAFECFRERDLKGFFYDLVCFHRLINPIKTPVF